MRVLVLTAAQRLPNLSTLYAHLATRHELDVRVLEKAQQLALQKVLATLDPSDYARIFIDLPFRQIQAQWRTLRTLSEVWLYEEDASQNYMRHSKRFGEFSRFYERLPNARVIVTGATLAQRLRQDGINAVFLGKGYDPRMLYVDNPPRDIELAFIGRLRSDEYAERLALLQQLALNEPLRFMRTEPGAAYREALNRIQMFVSADIGFGEYMAKNFEAMACGCLLLAWRQPDEEQVLGLRDGEHLLLYSSVEELVEHVRQLRLNPERLQRIAEAGRNWVTTQRSYLAMAEQLATWFETPWPAPPPIKFSPWWRYPWR